MPELIYKIFVLQSFEIFNAESDGTLEIRLNVCNLKKATILQKSNKA